MNYDKKTADRDWSNVLFPDEAPFQVLSFFSEIFVAQKESEIFFQDFYILFVPIY